MAAALTCFEDVAALSLDEASRVLQGPDAAARVWAAWFIGHSLGTEAVEGLQLALEVEPDPGVQRHLLIVLCGLGVHAPLARRAARDPDPHVRATSTRYLARITEPDGAGAYDLLAARMLDIAAVVRANLADALRPDAPEPIVRLASGFLFDPDPGVREVFERRIARGDFPREPFAAALRMLASAAVVLPDAPVRPSRMTALARVRPNLELV